MFLKRVVISLLAFIIIFSTPGCGIIGSNSAPSPIVENHNSGISLTLSKPPKLGDTAEITFKAFLKYFTWVYYKNIPQDTAKTRMWIKFTRANIKGSYSEAKYAVEVPLEQVLVKGDLSWEGNPFQNGDVIELHSTIKFPQEGVWLISSYFSGENKDPTAYLGTVDKPIEEDIRLSITKEAAAVWRSRESRSSPVAYLNNFSYGQLGRPTLSTDLHPIITELDISKAPKVGEETLLTCHVSSLYDIPDFSVQITFRKRTDGDRTEAVPENNLLINGSLSWKGDLKKDTPPQLYATIKFPESGDWWIHVQGNYPATDRPGIADEIKLNVNRNRGYFGWENSF